MVILVILMAFFVTLLILTVFELTGAIDRYKKGIMTNYTVQITFNSIIVAKDKTELGEIIEKYYPNIISWEIEDEAPATKEHDEP